MSPSGSRVLSRWRAAGIHLGASFALALLAGLLIFGLWYPQPYTQAAGADRLVMLLISIDLVLGPLLTLIVYKHGKRGMAFDIVFIAVVQLAALIYGLIVISQSRPVFIVVTKDVTYLTSARDLAEADLAAAQEAAFRKPSWFGPVMVAAPPPDSAAGREEVLTSGMAGKDINVLPKYFRPFAGWGAEMIQHARPLQALANIPAAREKVASFVTEHGLPIDRLSFQPLRGRDPEKDFTLVFDREKSLVLGVIQTDPWPAMKSVPETDLDDTHR